MNIFKSTLFPYIAGESLQGQTVNVTIAGFMTKDVKNHKGEPEPKCIISFKETDKTLILNKTNARVLAKMFGAETDNWVGNRITLFSEEVRAFGKVSSSVRIAAKPPVSPPVKDAPMPQQMAIPPNNED